MNDWTTEQLLFAVFVTGVVIAAGIWATFGLLSYALKTTKKPSGNGNGSSANGILDWIAHEPVRFRAIVVATVGSLATLGASFGLNMSAEQTGAIVGVIVTVAIGVAELGRRKVTPVSEPNMEAIAEAAE